MDTKIIEKQKELIDALQTYSTHVVIMWIKDLEDNESKDLKLELWGKVKDIREELSALESKPEKELWCTILEKPKEGIEYICFNPEWIDEDFNPLGIRVGTLCGDGSWEIARWNASHDCYISDNDKVPTHWMPLPTSPNKLNW